MIIDHRLYTIKPNRLNQFLETYERLALLKRKHDPENLFRSNQNIAPA